MAEIEVLGLYPDDPTSGKARAKAAQSGDTYLLPRTTAQVSGTEFQIYNTADRTTNYERGFFRFDSNTFKFGTEKAGTGSSRAVHMFAGGTRFLNSDGTFVQVDKDLYVIGNRFFGANYTELGDMATPTTPAANKCRVYAKDNGSGKTQFVVLMPDGVETVLATES